MYKTMMAIATAAILTACTGNAEEKTKEPTEEPTVQLSDEQQFTDTRQEPQSTGADTESKPNEEKVYDHQQFSSFPEYDRIIEQIGNKDYTFIKKIDNDSQRIFLIDLNDQQYKSIYMKKTKRLKLIEINGNGEIYNEQIK